MNGLEIAAVCIALLLSLPVARWVRAWRKQWASAKHVVRLTEAEAEMHHEWRDFRGSMNLDDEYPDWREATMAELSPEALDSGPGVAPSVFSPGPAPDVDGGPTVSGPEGAKGVNAPPVHHARLAQGFLSPSSLEPVWERLAEPADIDAAHTTHPHPGEDWLDGQLAVLYAWVRNQLETTA